MPAVTARRQEAKELRHPAGLAVARLRLKCMVRVATLQGLRVGTVGRRAVATLRVSVTLWLLLLLRLLVLLWLLLRAREHGTG